MAGRATGYTRFVRAMRVLLPLAALGILSTLFLIAERVDTGNPFVFEDLNLADVLLQPGIRRPEFAAQTNTGEQVRLSADEVVSDPSGTISAKNILFRVTDPFGAELELVAQTGVVLVGSENFEFAGQVVLTTSAGLRISTNKLVAARDMSWLEFTEPINATAPFGQFSAQAARVERQMSKEGIPSYRLLFQDGVKLVYTHDE